MTTTKYRSPEQRRLEAEKVYHEKCIAQYRESAAKLTSERMSLRAMDNAQFHERKLKQVEAQLTRQS